MSAITNNIGYHTAHGDAPTVTPSNVVLRSFGISLHKRWPDSDQAEASTVVIRSIGARLSKRWPDGETYSSQDIMKGMSLGYYGWKYLNQNFTPQPATPPMAMPIHHK